MKKAIKVVTIVILSIVALVGMYLAYISIQFYRIDDEQDLTAQIENNSDGSLTVNNTYSIATHNIGFGAYTKEFSFFMDSGVMKTGEEVAGTNSTAKDKATVLENTNGAIEIASFLDPDFYFFQEVDIKATRSHRVNQFALLQESLDGYASVIALNFHSAFLFYPFHDPHGATKAGIATFSKYQLLEATRYKLPIDESFPNKFFDLDRCIMLHRIEVENGKELVLINVHLSAYDEGGLIRAQQLETLSLLLESEYQKGNYIIVGGDFNHDIAASLNSFPTEQEVPEWVYVLEESQLPEGFTFATSNAHPTCRSTDIPYEEGVNYTVVIDGFIMSDNILNVKVENIVSILSQDVSFKYSDHNAVYFEFQLIG